MWLLDSRNGEKILVLARCREYGQSSYAYVMCRELRRLFEQLHWMTHSGISGFYYRNSDVMATLHLQHDDRVADCWRNITMLVANMRARCIPLYTKISHSHYGLSMIANGPTEPCSLADPYSLRLKCSRQMTVTNALCALKLLPLMKQSVSSDVHTASTPTVWTPWSPRTGRATTSDAPYAGGTFWRRHRTKKIKDKNPRGQNPSLVFWKLTKPQSVMTTFQWWKQFWGWS